MGGLIITEQITRHYIGLLID